MPRFAALLRAINVGGHIVKMAELVRLFEAMRFGNVETLIASGNVLFDSPATDAATLEARIEEHLRAALGYAAETFVRNPAELATITERVTFADDPVLDAHTLHVIFLRSALDAEGVRRVLALASTYDDFLVAGREVYWRCRGRSSDSKIAPAAFARALGMPGTARSITTVRKLAVKIAAGPAKSTVKGRARG